MYKGETQIQGLYVGENEVTAIYEGETQIYSGGTPTPPGPTDYSTMPLTFEIISGGNINWASASMNNLTIEYRKNDEQWTSITSQSGNGRQIPVIAGDVVEFRGDNPYYGSGLIGRVGFGTTTAVFNVYGNIMSLIDSTNYASITSIDNNYTKHFYYFFAGCSGLTSAENLVLPATTLAESCYSKMFVNCSGLTIAPVLPATTLANYCYLEMFLGCTSLVVPPALPATALTISCYNGMFSGCTSLTTAPELTAPLLTDYCYNAMFYGCSSLNYIKCMAEHKSATNCTNTWVYGVSSSGTFVKHYQTSWSTSGTSGVPYNWTIVDDPSTVPSIIDDGGGHGDWGDYWE